MKSAFPHRAPLQVQHTSAWPWPSGATIKNVSEKKTISIYMSHVSAATLLRLTVPFNHKTILPSYVLQRTHTYSNTTRWDTYMQKETHAGRTYEHVTSYGYISQTMNVIKSQHHEEEKGGMEKHSLFFLFFCCTF